MSNTGGRILAEEAYAQGKMLNNSGWKLPRGTTPSDIDLCFDNNGLGLVCELSRHHALWREIPIGQRRLYESKVRRGDLAVLLKHSVPSDRQINTRDDIDAFSFMYLCGPGRVAYSQPFDGAAWPVFVENWYVDSFRALRAFLVDNPVDSL